MTSHNSVICATILLLCCFSSCIRRSDADGTGTCVAQEDGTCAAPGASSYDFFVVIYSFERPRQLLLLLKDVYREAEEAQVKIGVHVVDDNSLDCIYNPDPVNVYDSRSLHKDDLHEYKLNNLNETVHICRSLPRFQAVLRFLDEHNGQFYSARQRHGKRRYWHLVAQAHQLLEKVDSKLFLFLPDDDRLCSGFFTKAAKIWNDIADPRKASLMLHIEASREHVAVWTPIKPSKEGHVFRIGWVESGNFLCDSLFLQTLNYTLPRVDTSRWDARPTLSSGVGATMSEILFRKKLSMFRSEKSLLAHVGNRDSKMNPTLRQGEQLVTLYFEDGKQRLEELMAEPRTVAATMASKWTRIRALQNAVYSLAPQVDRVYVYLNDYEFIPAYLLGLSWVNVVQSQDASGDIGDAGKFFWAGKLDVDYVFTADDDIIYPSDYVDRLSSFLDSYRPPVVAGLHGINFIESKLKPKMGQSKGYYASREVFMGFEAVAEPHDVNILGTGLVAYRPEDLKTLSVEFFKEPNMADVWLGVYAKLNKIPMVVMPHEDKYITTVGGTAEDSLYVRYTRRKRADKKLTDIVLREWPWPVLSSSLHTAEKRDG
mmetsp:Transcript_4341/g.13130  ORF Transcript_4341/g.13130 Transcript_4341/m.13130 type:complete len:598 (-) Transcript_4341:382-2175(-)